MQDAVKLLPSPVSFEGWAAVGGALEEAGPLGKCFDKINTDPYLSAPTFERGEAQLQKQAVRIALEKNGLTPDDIDLLLGGDLLNQCTGTTFGIKDYGIPFLGVYSACSTMTEALSLGAALISGGFAARTLAVTSSHFCTAERQYRSPLNYGGQRTPNSQWTATAGGAAILSAQDKAPYIRAFTVGRITDLGITDANNMGAAMAPAAYSTIKEFLTGTGMTPESFDFIVTGDLGKVGSRLLWELFDRDGIELRDIHRDCGKMLYDFETQDVHAGGSGCGCCASVLCGYFLPRLRTGELKNILLSATGALLSPTVNQQGESIPGISHLIWLSHDRG